MSNHPTRTDRKYYQTGIAVELGDVPLEAPASGSFVIGINFRDSSGYVTDGTDETYCLGEGDAYPTTRAGVDFGWNSINGDAGRDRDSGVDRRLAGRNGQENTGTQAEFQLDLPQAGDYNIRLALGDATGTENYQRVDIYDDSTLLFSIVDTDGTTGGTFDDATGTNYSAANWPGSNTAVTHTFATTTLILKLGSTSAQANTSTIAHLFVELAAASGAYAIDADPGAYTLTGTAASLEQGYEIAGGVGSYAVTGAAASLEQGYKLTAAAGSYAMSGTAATLTHNTTDPTLTADPGSYSLTGTAASLEQGYKVAGATGGYAITGTAASLEQGYEVSAASGSYSLTGTAASLEQGYEAQAAAGSYSLTGTDATLTYTPGSGETLSAESGAYSLTGTAASLEQGYRLTAAPGSCALTGTAASLERGRKLSAAAGAYTLNGSAAAVLIGRRIQLATGTYLVTGAAASFPRSRILTSPIGSYTLTGVAAAFEHGGQIPVAARSVHSRARSFGGLARARRFVGKTSERDFGGG